MVGLIDSTLREGEQMARVYFSLAQKMQIIEGLSAIGIEEIELGTATHDSEMPELMAAARRTAPNAKLALWCRCLPEDIACAAELKPDVLSLCVPVSDLHIRKRLRKSRDWVLTQIGSAVSIARSKGLKNVSLGLEDVTRADMEFLRSALGCAAEAGVDRVRLSDTLGIATPADILVLARNLVERYSFEIGIHTHNDFGMATANAITALEAGFDWADVSVLGLGERAGIARLEEVVAYLGIKGRNPRYGTTHLRALCELVAGVAGALVYPHHPVVGRGIFTCESGLHLDGLTKDPVTYEPYPPELVNGVREKVFGKKSGRNALQDKMSDLGILVSGDRATLLISQVKTQSRLMGRPLRDSEIKGLLGGIRI